jgi:hypothetical protein
MISVMSLRSFGEPAADPRRSRFHVATGIFALAPTVSECAETAHLASDRFRLRSGLGTHDRSGDIPQPGPTSIVGVPRIELGAGGCM